MGESNLVSEFDIEQTEANRDLAISDTDIIKVRIRQIDDQIRRANVRTPFSGIVISCTHRAAWILGRYESRTVLTAMGGRKYESTTEIPNRLSGPEISGLPLVPRHNGSFVFRINTENKAERIKVTIGDSAGNLTAVSGSLVEGD